MHNFEERVRIKRRLIDLAHESQNQQVEKSHAQVGISQWESARIQAPSAEQDTPQNIHDLQEKLQSLKSEMARTEETTHGLEDMLVGNQQVAERLQVELPSRVQNKDMRAFLGLMSRIYVMEVENMDMQEMNDVAVPLLQQKELEIEALRLQIRMRDRMIEDQDQLLMSDDVGLAPRPEGWVEISAKSTRNVPSPFHVREEDKRGNASSGEERETPRGRRAGGSAPGLRSLSQPPESAARGGMMLPPLSSAPTRGRTLIRDPQQQDHPVDRGLRGRGGLSGASTPPAGPSIALGSGGGGGGGGGSWGGSSGSKAPPPGGGPPHAAAQPRPLDVAGRGLGQPWPRPSPGAEVEGVGPQPPRTPPRDPISRPPPSAPTPLGGGGSHRGSHGLDAWQDGDPDSTRLPCVEGFHAIPPDRRLLPRPAPADGGPGSGRQPAGDGRQRLAAGSAVGQRRSRKKNRWAEAAGRALREKDHQPIHLHIEASGLQRERDDVSQGSDSEHITPPGTSARGDAAPAPKDPAAERRGIIDKLNRKMKPSYPPMGAPKSVHGVPGALPVQ